MLEIFTSPELLIAFFTLTALELVLGIDNIIFISILVDKLPPERRAFARRLGLFLAMFMRLGLLAALSFLAGMTAPWFTLPVLDQPISGRDLILIVGGLFLVWKSVGEVHQLMEGEEGEASSAVKATFAAVITQIILIDLVFSLDSIITAIGMVNNLPVMMAAVIASVGLKMLALSFLMVVGVVLIVDGFGHHVPKGYIYFAMAFSVSVEMLNIRMRKKAQPVALHEPYVRESASAESR